jgi:hypothetical protein
MCPTLQPLQGAFCSFANGGRNRTGYRGRKAITEMESDSPDESQPLWYGSSDGKTPIAAARISRKPQAEDRQGPRASISNSAM